MAMMAQARKQRVESYDIRVFDDVPFAVLLERRSFKPVTRQLRELNIHYRWGASGTLVVPYGEEVLTPSVGEDPVAFLVALLLPQCCHGAPGEDRTPIATGYSVTWEDSSGKKGGGQKPQQQRPP
ncbi:Hypothetical predicted protein [Pelobates cultripes]|uniref:Uncharacterized protein n=1 Tax=Pelobates cultripes TaxID=61616 RepID=A0AAD1SV45_PELCU|nr:Hypothetical predicted protein [Pelobates cultripes]